MIGSAGTLMAPTTSSCCSRSSPIERRRRSDWLLMPPCSVSSTGMVRCRSSIAAPARSHFCSMLLASTIHPATTGMLPCFMTSNCTARAR